MADPSADERRILAAIPAVEQASGTPHAEALAVETGLRVDQVETLTQVLVGRGLLTVEGIGASDPAAWTSQPAYRLTPDGRAVLG